MESIQHKHVDVRGLQLHVAELGSGSTVVVFLHGFPEVWYSWRHQMLAVADCGYRAIAPDWRGYGLSQHPPQEEWGKASFVDLREDLLALLDSLNIPKAFLVAKDFGAWPVYDFALVHPERVLGVVTLGVPFLPASFNIFNSVPEGFYVMRWLEPGRAEADFGRYDAKTVVKNIYILFSGSELPIASKDEEIMDMVDPSTPLPSWFSEEDLSVYGALYEKSGFHFPLNVPYRCWGREANILDPKVKVPALLIMGEKDYVIKCPGMDDYIRSGKVKEYVPDLQVIFMPEGTHFVQEQFPDKINQLLFDFLKTHA